MSERVLIAVEDAEAREALADRVRRCGFVPIPARGEAQIAALLRGAPPPIVIASVPLLPSFGPNRPDRPVLLATGEASLTEVLLALRAGALDYLALPVPDDTLVVALEHARERLPAPRPIARVEQLEIERALRETGGNRVQAARLLGISVRTLFNRLKRYRQDAGPGVPA